MTEETTEVIKAFGAILGRLLSILVNKGILSQAEANFIIKPVKDHEGEQKNE